MLLSETSTNQSITVVLVPVPLPVRVLVLVTLLVVAVVVVVVAMVVLMVCWLLKLTVPTFPVCGLLWAFAGLFIPSVRSLQSLPPQQTESVSTHSVESNTQVPNTTQLF